MSDLDDDELKATRKLNGADKYSEADEMFEKLGYKLEHYHYNCDNSDIYTYHEKNKTNFLRFKTSSQTFYSLFDKTYNVEELNAIFKKCEELGWI